MHELAVTEGILKTAVEASERNGAHRITAINLVIGELSSVVDDSVQFYFDFLSKGTLAENAVLHFRREPSIAICLDCAHQFNVSAPLEPKCPQCGSARLRVKGGRDFNIESIEVEDEDSRR
ncbi:MAG: hydrogenase maturation nickel metallochaperone HypA [Anaerolineales bacterium]|nr:hydrogenase maturation nickel metallochaperone HypA [Anaerolineales bacterium]